MSGHRLNIGQTLKPTREKNLLKGAMYDDMKYAHDISYQNKYFSIISIEY